MSESCKKVQSRIRQGQKAGKELYKFLPLKDQAVLAYGMIPMHLRDYFVKELKSKLTGDIAKPGSPFSGLESEKIEGCIKKEVIAEYERGFVLGLLDGAKENNKLMV